MIYEMRDYDMLPGMTRRVLDRFGNTHSALFKKHGIRPVGFWTESIGDSSKFHFMIAGESHEERLTKWGTFREDPVRLAALDAEPDQTVARFHNSIWTPTSFSPLP